MVGDDDILIYQPGTVDVVDEPVEDGFAANSEERLGKVLREGIKAGGITRGKNETLHYLRFYYLRFTILLFV